MSSPKVLVIIPLRVSGGAGAEGAAEAKGPSDFPAGSWPPRLSSGVSKQWAERMCSGAQGESSASVSLKMGH